MADRVFDRGGSGRESVGDGSVAGSDYRHGVCRRRVVSGESAHGDFVGGCDGDGEVWDFHPVRLAGKVIWDRKALVGWDGKKNHGMGTDVTAFQKL